MLKLKELRIKNDLTQKQVADKLCIAESTLSLYESGQRKPNINKLIEFAQLFNCTLDELVV